MAASLVSQNSNTQWEGGHLIADHGVIFLAIRSWPLSHGRIRFLQITYNNPAASIKATIWATAEPGTGIVAASAAILRPLFRKIYSDVREKYGTGNASRQDPTMPWKTITSNGDTESVIGLTSVATTKGSNSRISEQSMRSIELNEPWDTSVEQARVGVGHAVVITAGNQVRTVPLRKK